MMRFDATSAECVVYTCTEGLLAAIAHDLKIRVTAFVIAVDEQARAVDARFDARSLRVVCAMRDGVEAPHTLTAANKHEIEANIARDVLHAEQYPEIRFVSVATDRGHNDRVKGYSTSTAIAGRSSSLSAVPARPTQPTRASTNPISASAPTPRCWARCGCKRMSLCA